VTVQPEAKLSRAIAAHLRRAWPVGQLFVFKTWGSVHQLAGLPDLIGCVEGRFFGLEIKLPASRKNVSARQELVLGWILAAGGIADVACSPKEAEKILRDALESGNCSSHDSA
jgi:hypothetical protein